MKRIDWFILAIVVYAFWVFDVFVAGLLDLTMHYEYLTAIWLAICIGQINLIGAWGALAPGKVIVRLPWAAFLGVLMWHAIALGQYFEGEAPSERLTLGVAIGFGVFVTQVPLWFARAPFRWRLLPPRFPIEKVAETDAQFNLKHLFVGMFFASLALALARFMLTDLKARDFGIDGELYILLPVTAICNAAGHCPVYLDGIFHGDTSLRVGGGMDVLCAGRLGRRVACAVYFSLGPPGGGSNFVLVFACLNLSQCLTVFGTMLLLRWMGFKLIRADRTAPNPATIEPHAEA